MAASYITYFIQSLNSEEIKLINKNLNKSKDDITKLSRLLNLLTEDQDKSFSDADLSRIFNSTPAAIRVLKSRLLEKIKEVLVHDEHFENKSVFNDRETHVFILKKKILFVKSIARNRNQKRMDAIDKLLDEIIQTAREKQVFDVLVEALTLQKYMRSTRFGLNDYKRITDLIGFYNNCFQSVQRAFDAYYHITLNIEFINSLTGKELQDYTKCSIQQMEIDFKKTKAIEIYYFILILKMAFYEQQRDYKQALNYCKKLLGLVKKTPIIYSKDRIAFALLNLSYFSVFNENFRDGVSYAARGKQFHIPNSHHYIKAIEQEFFVHFYDKNYTSAQNCIAELLKYPITDIGTYRNSKFVFYKSCVLFQIGKYKEALQLLSKTLKIEADKAGWNISLRLLITMVFIETKNNLNATKNIDALRKYLDRNKKSKQIKHRDFLIVKLLRELEKDNFSFNHKNTIALKIQKELTEKNTEVSWSYFTPELIPFHNWVKTLPVKN
jgi:tetratricopeptide (TPR) repeat protein